MFRNVPEYSGMFHVPGFIDARTKQAYASKYQSHVKGYHHKTRLLVTCQLSCPEKTKTKLS